MPGSRSQRLFADILFTYSLEFLLFLVSFRLVDMNGSEFIKFITWKEVQFKKVCIIYPLGFCSVREHVTHKSCFFRGALPAQHGVRRATKQTPKKRKIILTSNTWQRFRIEMAKRIRKRILVIFRTFQLSHEATIFFFFFSLRSFSAYRNKLGLIFKTNKKASTFSSYPRPHAVLRMPP